MKIIDYCIIGGGIAGTSAAESIRQHDPKGTILIISGEPHRLYSRVMLSKTHYILNESPKDGVYLRTNKNYKDNLINLEIGVEAMSLNTTLKEVQLLDGRTIHYKKLLLALGGKAKNLDPPNRALKGIFPLQNLDQTKRVIEALPSISKIVVVGSGFLGFEMSSIFAQAGKNVTLCIRKGFIWQNILSRNASSIIEKELLKNGVTIEKNCEIKKIIGTDKIEGVKLSTNVEIPCGMLVYGIGNEYKHRWISNSGIKQKTGIVCDQYLKTSADDVWAAGDCVEYPETKIENNNFMAANWAHAQTQGIYVGKAMALDVTEPFSHISSYTSSGCGLTLSFIGDSKRAHADETIIRGHENEHPKFGELFIKNKRLIGAVLINRGNEIVPLIKLISQRRDVGSIKKELQTSDFDLKMLL